MCAYNCTDEIWQMFTAPVILYFYLCCLVASTDGHVVPFWPTAIVANKYSLSLRTMCLFYQAPLPQPATLASGDYKLQYSVCMTQPISTIQHFLTPIIHLVNVHLLGLYSNKHNRHF